MINDKLGKILTTHHKKQISLIIKEYKTLIRKRLIIQEEKWATVMYTDS